MNARAIVFTGVNQVEVQAVTIPDPEPGQLVLEALATCVSPGTELRCLAGKQPDYAFPAIPGYAFVGRALNAAGDFHEGDLVFCGGTEAASVARGWGGHISHAIHHHSTCLHVPEGLDPAHAAIARLAAISLRGVRMTRPVPGTTVAVVGLGPIGQFSARLFHAAGSYVVGFDLAQERVDALRGVGVPAERVTGRVGDAVRAVFTGGAQIVVDATGAPAVLPESLLAVRDIPWVEPHESPALVVQGSYPAEFALDYQTAFMKELRLLFPRDSMRADQEAVLHLIATGRLPVADMIARRPSFEEAPAVYAALQAEKGSALTVAFRWS